MVTSIHDQANRNTDNAVQYCYMALYKLTECSIETYEAATQTLLRANHAEPVSFLQAPLYGKIQAGTGKSVVYCTIHTDSRLIGCGLAVAYTAPGGLRFLYAPYGPICSEWNQELYAAVKSFYKPIALRLGCTFVRLDTDNLPTSTQLRPISSRLARTASLQPRSEWLLDTNPEVQTLWEAFHKHARYNVRLAERANADIKVYEPRKAPLDTFFALMQVTSDRDQFGIFNRDYYASYLQNLTADDGFVIVCSIDGKPAAAGLFVIYDAQAHYVFAGSANEFRKIAPAYSVIWHAVQEAKRLGCTRLNFGGVRDAVKGQDLTGVTAFKKRFGGYVVHHVNPIDIVYRPFHYFLFRLYKMVR